MIQEEALSEETLLSEILSLYENRGSFVEAMEKSASSHAVDTIAALICEVAKA